MKDIFLKKINKFLESGIFLTKLPNIRNWTLWFRLNVFLNKILKDFLYLHFLTFHNFLLASVSWRIKQRQIKLFLTYSLKVKTWEKDKFFINIFEKFLFSVNSRTTTTTIYEAESAFCDIKKRIFNCFLEKLKLMSNGDPHDLQVQIRRYHTDKLKS